MGRGSSGLKNGGGHAVTEVAVQSGITVKLNMPLIYGDKDPAITGNLRNVLEAQEAKHLNDSIEYGYGAYDNGDVVMNELVGTSEGVRVPVYVLNESVAFTHSHPRGAREDAYMIGGTFSKGDMDLFSLYAVRTYRASAAEGTYSITKSEKFNAKGFFSYYKNKFDSNMNDFMQKRENLKKRSARGEFSSYDDYLKHYSAAFNDMLISNHNALREGQSKYGYSYTLERR